MFGERVEDRPDVGGQHRCAENEQPLREGTAWKVIHLQRAGPNERKSLAEALRREVGNAVSIGDVGAHGAKELRLPEPLGR